MGRQMPFSERLAAGCIAGTWALTCDLAMDPSIGLKAPLIGPLARTRTDGGVDAQVD